MHSMRSHARWLVDSTWKLYVFNQQDSSTAGIAINEYHSDTVASNTQQEIDLFADTTDVRVNNEPATLEYPHQMNTGYDDLNKSIVGKATLGMRDQPGDEDLSPLVGRHVIVNVSAFIDSSTKFDNVKPTKLEVDLGKLLIGAVWLAGPTLTTSTYTRRVTAAASGILASAVAGKWVINLAWQMNHGAPINDQFDNFILHVDVSVFGYQGIRALLLIDR